jgi:hypothetical protein
MRRLNGKVTSPLSLLQDIYSFVDFFIFIYVALIAKLEAAEKTLADERATRLVVVWSLVDEKTTRLIANRSLADERIVRQAADQSLQGSEEANAPLNLDRHQGEVIFQICSPR